MTRTIECRNALPTTRIVEHLFAELSSATMSMAYDLADRPLAVSRLGHTEGAEVVLAQQPHGARLHGVRIQLRLDPPGRGSDEHRRSSGPSTIR